MTGHGGNIYQASRETGIPADRIIDFSASINPLGVPRSASAEIRKGIRSLSSYPEPFAREFTEHIALHYGIRKESIICGNGSTELIYLITRALNPEKVLIPVPTFSEYERAVISHHSLVNNHKQKGRYQNRIDYLFLKRELNFNIDSDGFISSIKRNISKPKAMAFLCNPNNPTGRLMKRQDVLKIANAAKQYRCFLVVDEAFIDFCPEESVINEVEDNPYLIVIRSMTKFYALSGLRIGFGVLHPSIITTVMRHKEPWTVNTLAQKAGIAAINDLAYKEETLSFIRREKDYLEDGFRRSGIEFIPSEANYYLLKINRAKQIISSLKSKGILVRDCSNFAGLDNTYIRAAVKSRKDNRILLRELSILCRD